VKQLNIQIRFTVDEDAWPPDQPQNFTPVTLVHHKDLHTFNQAAALQVAGYFQSGRHYSTQDSHKSLIETLDYSKTTKELADILAPLQESDNAQFILVEGLPGVGKSLLLQEIACNWAKGKVLQKFKVALYVRLCSPAVQEISLLTDFFRAVCEGDEKASDIALASSDYFFENKGKQLVFLFDGFDEFPENLQKESLITSILKRKVLPHCGLIVSSRSHASVRLREKSTVKVDILGFAEEEQRLYIEQSLKGQPNAVNELTEYLKNNVSISGLCFVPFNMVILIYLYKQGIPFPSNSTQLYNYFIYLTICRHFAKCGHSLENTIPELANIPEPCNTIVKQLSKLAFDGLNDNKLIFTLQEMRSACPNIAAIAGAINGFGLLQAIQHFGLTGKTMTFNFVHFSIQEFLAAYHITQLSPDIEQQVLNEKFWSDHHSNMFTMYISLTKGQRSAFKQYLSCGDSKIAIGEIFLQDQLKCLHLFRCFHEAKNKATYTPIQNARIFYDKVIDLADITLSPYDVECVTLFLIHSPHKQWEKLNLQLSHIQDYGLRVLHRYIVHSNVTIRVLSLINNGLTRLSSSCISDLTIHCRVEELVIVGNDTIGENPALYNILSHPSSRLVKLNMAATSLTSSAAIVLFTALALGDKLQWLYISYNNITDEACDAIAMSLKTNTSLVRLRMYNNKNISAVAAQRIVQALQHNDTLQELALSDYNEDVEERIRALQEEVIKKRRNRGCQTQLSIY